MTTPADTNEWRWIPVYQQTNPEDPESKELFTGAIEYAIYREGTQPAGYTPAVIRDTYTGIKITGLDPGTYRVRAHVTGAPGGDVPSIDCGTFTLKA
jgi:hypothetical protein